MRGKISIFYHLSQSGSLWPFKELGWQFLKRFLTLAPVAAIKPNLKPFLKMAAKQNLFANLIDGFDIASLYSA